MICLPLAGWCAAGSALCGSGVVSSSPSSKSIEVKTSLCRRGLPRVANRRGLSVLGSWARCGGPLVKTARSGSETALNLRASSTRFPCAYSRSSLACSCVRT